MASYHGRTTKRLGIASKSDLEPYRIPDSTTQIGWIWSHIDKCPKCTFIKKHVHRTDIPTLDTIRRRHRRVQYKLNPKYFHRAIRAICEAETIAASMPTIDCFASRLTVQTGIVMFIDKAHDFFSKRFECIAFWQDNIAWAHPPHSDLKATIDAFARRGICGYVCGRKGPWVNYAQKKQGAMGLGYRTQYNVGGRGRRDIYFASTHGCEAGDGSACAFDTVVVYVDFRMDLESLSSK